MITFFPEETEILSGRPGYITGKPVRIATKTGETLSNVRSMKVMNFDQCSSIYPNAVLSSSEVIFGEEKKVSCSFVRPTIAPTTSCAAVQATLKIHKKICHKISRKAKKDYTVYFWPTFLYLLL